MKYLSREMAAKYLVAQGRPVAKTTLQKYATVGGGPKYRRFGNRVLYTEDDLLAWADSKMSAPMTSSSSQVAA